MDAARPRRRNAPVGDLWRIFGPRLESLVADGGRAPDWSHCMALVSSLTMDDLTELAEPAGVTACA